MNLEAEKIELLKLILETESEEVIQEIKGVFKRQAPNFWYVLPGSVKESINRGSEDVEANRVQNHNFVMKGIKVRYGLNDNCLFYCCNSIGF